MPMPLCSKRWLAAAAFLLSCAPAAWASKPVHVPDWVLVAAHRPTPRLRPHDAAVVLLDETAITVDPAGRATVHERKVIKLLTTAGERYADYRLYYDAQAKVQAVHSWTIGADEHPYALDDKDVTDTTAVPDFAVFDSERVKVAHALAGEPGAIVAFESQMTEAPFTTSWRYDLDAMIPTTGRTVSLTLPQGFTQMASWAHIAPVAPAQSGTTWVWTLPDRASIDDEDATPEWGEVAARMLLAYSGPGVQSPDGSWAAVGAWFGVLAADRSTVTPEIQAKVASLTAGKTTFAEKLFAITAFLQDDIRYVAVEMGIGGWQPHFPADVFRNRYGDCKDKATLLIAMLSAAGIPAHPVIVDFDHAIDPALPTHYADHMIVAIDVPAAVDDPRLQATVPWKGKRLLIFDPTDAAPPVGSLEPELQGTWGVVLAGEDSAPVQLPVLRPGFNVLHRTGTFVLGKDGSLAGDVTEVREGNTADLWRHFLLAGDATELQKRAEGMVGTSLTGFTLTGLGGQPVRDRILPLRLQYHLMVSQYAKHAGAMLLLRPSVVGLYRVRDVENGRPRLYPIALGQQEAVDEEDTITVPEGWKAEDMPDAAELHSSFASFTSAVSFDGKQLHYTRHLQINALELPASEAAEYQKFFGQVGNAERSEAILKPAS